MPFIPFPEFRPDVDDFRGEHTQVLEGVLPRGDGWGPFPGPQASTAALPGACRGMFSARKTDGTAAVFAATANRLFIQDNTDLTWIPVSKVTALTSISQADPGVFTLSAHGLSNGDAIVLSTSGTLPTGLVAGTVYYVVNKADNTFNVALTLGGDGVETTGAGSGTHSMTYFYTSVSSSDNWQFAQHGNNVVAVQANSVPQVYNLSTGGAFTDLTGSPPTARYVAVVGLFLVLTGLTAAPLRVQWSDLDDITDWSTGFAGSFDAPDGGVVRGAAGGEFGLIFQESVIRRMVYIPGATPAFQIERVAEDKGLLGAYAIVRAGERVIFGTEQGFQEFFGGLLTPIGKERVDRTFLADVDTAHLNLFVGASDPTGTRAYFAYKSKGNPNTTHFDKILVYDYGIKRWSPPIQVNGEYIASIVKTGFTLDGLDAIAASIDDLPFTLDSVQSALGARLAIFDTDHKLGFFDGANLEAVLETPEQGMGSRRMFISGLMPRTDASTVFCSIRHRANAQSPLSATAETAVNVHGLAPQRVDTRLARGRVRIPAGQVWRYAMGLEPQFRETGRK